MLNFQIPDTSKTVDPIRRKIEQQYQSLHNLIHLNNGFFQQEEERVRREHDSVLTKLHEQHKGEDKDLHIPEETEIADRYQWEEEVLFYTENNFYHAAFILSFSYFESIVAAMCKDPENYVKTNAGKVLTDSGQSLSNEDQVEVHYNSEDEAIYGMALLEKDMCLRIAHDIDGAESNLVVFSLFHNNDVLLSDICKIDVLIKHLNKYLH